MTWIIACFCGNVIDTPVCPHCGSRLPDWSTGRPKQSAGHLPLSNGTPSQPIDRPPGVVPHKKAA